MLKVTNVSTYDETLEKLKLCYDEYVNYDIENTKYTLCIANGEFLNIRIPRNQVPHLLGVLPEKLKIAGVVKKELSMFEIFKKMLDYDLSFYTIKNKNSGFQMSSLFSEHIDTKMEIFMDNIKIRANDIYAIVKYKKERTYTSSENTQNSDYFIIRYIDNKYYILGIANVNQDKTGTDYIPVTSRMYDDYSEFMTFLEEISRNQEITYAYNFKSDNYQSNTHYNFYTRYGEKKALLERLARIKEKFDAIPSVAGDDLANIKKGMEDEQKNYIKISVLNLLIDSIRNGYVLSQEKIKEVTDDKDLPYEYNSLINACNDLICANVCVSSSTANSYSVMESENSKLKTELESYKQQLEEIKASQAELEANNNALALENENNVKKLSILTEAFEEVKKIK